MKGYSQHKRLCLHVTGLFTNRKKLKSLVPIGACMLWQLMCFLLQGLEDYNVEHHTILHAVFSPAYLRHVGPASLEYRFFFDVGKEVAPNL